MAAEAKLNVNINDKDLVDVVRTMREIGKQTGLTEKQIDDLEKSFKDAAHAGRRMSNDTNKGFLNLGKTVENVGKAFIAYFAVDRFVRLGKEIFNVTAEFQKLQAVLKNTLGSQSAADIAFSRIQAFASRTPFQVNELTAAFVKLAQRGFEPTTEQLRQLGDLAASQGKSFDQLVEAMLDAQTAEFERLKEFGIRARQEGDRVQFTFKGVTTEVEKTDKAIRDYILSLGDLEGVSGGMAAISETLSGKVSNTGDSFDRLFNTIGSANTGVLNDFFDWVIDTTDALTTMVQTLEQFEKELVGPIFEEVMKEFEGAETVDEINEALWRLQSRITSAKDEITDFNERIQNGAKNQDVIRKAIAATQARITAYEEVIRKLQDRLKDVGNEEENEIGRLKLLRQELKQLNEERENAPASEIEAYNIRIALIQEEIKKLLELGVVRRELQKATPIDPRETKRKAAEEAKIMRELFADWLAEGDKALEETVMNFTDAMDKRIKAHANAIEETSEAETDWQKYHREIIDESTNHIIGSVWAIFDAQSNRIQSELQMLQQKKDQEVFLAGENAELRKKTELKYDREIASLRREEARRNKDAATFQVAVDTIQAVMKAVASAPWPLNLIPIGFAVAQGALQKAAIDKVKIPAFAKGVKKAPPGWKLVGEEGPELINDRGGYEIKNARDSEKMLEKWNLMKDVPTRLRGDLFSGRRDMIDYEKMGRHIVPGIAKAIQDKEFVNFGFDRFGFHAYIGDRGRKTEIFNRKHS